MRIVIAMICVVCLAASGRPYAAVPDDPARVTPLEVGARAPVFKAREVDGRDFDFNPAQLKQPALIIFYRGGWCPYCNAHLKNLRYVEPKLRKLGFQVLFLSTDKPELLYSSLKEKVKYHLLSDASMQAARAFGVAYQLDAGTLKMLQTYGIDLDTTQGTHNHELPVPAVFIVDRSGTIRYRHFNPDYKVRLDGASLWAAAQEALQK